MGEVCFRRTLLIVLLGMLAQPCLAAPEKPLWEAGVGLATVVFPDYRGSDQHQSYLLPIPYLIYRGNLLRLGREGLRGLLYHSERISVDLSADGAIPVNSGHSQAREGMPNLDPVLQLGPSLKVYLWRNGGDKLRFEAAARGAFAVGSGVVQHGWLFAPQLQWIHNGGSSFSASAGPLYATRDFHGYYYDVDPAYARPERPAFKADGGYSGFRLALTASRRQGAWWFGGFVRYDDLSGAAFEDSPLVRQRYAVMAGLSFARIVSQSRRLVPARPELADTR